MPHSGPVGEGEHHHKTRKLAPADFDSSGGVLKGSDKLLKLSVVFCRCRPLPTSFTWQRPVAQEAKPAARRHPPKLNRRCRRTAREFLKQSYFHYSLICVMQPDLPEIKSLGAMQFHKFLALEL